MSQSGLTTAREQRLMHAVAHAQTQFCGGRAMDEPDLLQFVRVIIANLPRTKVIDAFAALEGQLAEAQRELAGLKSTLAARMAQRTVTRELFDAVQSQLATANLDRVRLINEANLREYVGRAPSGEVESDLLTEIERLRGWIKAVQFRCPESAVAALRGDPAPDLSQIG